MLNREKITHKPEECCSSMYKEERNWMGAMRKYGPVHNNVLLNTAICICIPIPRERGWPRKELFASFQEDNLILSHHESHHLEPPTGFSFH